MQAPLIHVYTCALFIYRKRCPEEIKLVYSMEQLSYILYNCHVIATTLPSKMLLSNGNTPFQICRSLLLTHLRKCQEFLS